MNAHLKELGATEAECQAIVDKLGPERLGRCVYHCTMGAKAVTIGFLPGSVAVEATAMGLAAATAELNLSNREMMLATIIASDLAGLST